MPDSTEASQAHQQAPIAEWIGAHRWWLILLVPVVAVAAYFNAFANPFNYDDYVYILGKTFYRDFGNLSHLVPPEFFSLTGEVTFRPLSVIPFFFSYSLFGLSPAGWRLFNFTFHVINACLAYWLVVTLSRKKVIAALASALIFAVHPIFTETINIVGFNDDIQALTFLLLAVISYAKISQGELRATWLAASLAAFVMSLLSKESAIVLPALLLAYEVVFNNRRLSIETAKRLAPFWLTAAGFALAYLTVFQTSDPSRLPPAYPGGSLYTALLNMPRIIAIYIKFLLLPIDQNISHQFTAWIRPDAVVLVSFLAAAGLGVMLFFLFKAGRQMECFALLWFLLGLLPVLHIIPVGIFIAERYVYVAALGLIVLVAVVLDEVASIAATQKQAVSIVSVAVLSIVITLAVATHQRNQVFRSDLTLWRDSASKSPGEALPFINLGNAYARAGALDKAETAFKTAARNLPNYAEPYWNLGRLYSQQGKKEAAVAMYLEAIDRDPTLVGAYNNVAAIYLESGDPDKAIAYYKRGIEVDPGNAMLYFNLGRAYEAKKMYDEAAQRYRYAARLDPTFAEAVEAVSRLREGQGR